ncbi:MAG: SsrA-binding protein SmpB [Myxococcota bacterium]
MSSDTPRQLIAANRRARHLSDITERLEAGIELRGTEVKSCRASKVTLADAYVQVMSGEAFLMNAHIAEYGHGNRFNHEPTRTRRLLLHARQIADLDEQLRREGMTAVPLEVYFSNGRVKVEIGIGRGRGHKDRRDHIKTREAEREIARVMRRTRS